MLGRGDRATDLEIPPEDYVAFARMADAGYSEHRIAEQFGLRAPRAKTFMGRIETAITGIEQDTVEKILDRKPPEEILTLPEDSEEFLDLACKMLGINSFKNSSGLGRREHIELLRTSLNYPNRNISSLSAQFGIAQSTVRHRVKVMQDRLANYSDEVMSHILGLGIQELESA